MDPDDIADLLRRVHTSTDEDLRRQFKRSLSFGDGLFDRWERASRLGFGENSSVYDSALGGFRIFLDRPGSTLQSHDKDVPFTFQFPGLIVAGP